MGDQGNDQPADLTTLGWSRKPVYASRRCFPCRRDHCVQAVNFGVRTLTKWWAQRDWWGPPHCVTRGLNRPVTIDGEVGQDKRPVRVQHAKRLLLALALAVVLACFRLRRADVCSLNSPQRPYRSCSGWKLKPPGWGWKLMGTNRTIKLSLQLHKRHRQAHRQASGNKRPHQPKPDKVR